MGQGELESLQGALDLDLRELDSLQVDASIAVDEVIGSLAVPTDALPAGITPAAIEVVDSGVRLTVTGTDLTLSELGQG